MYIYELAWLKNTSILQTEYAQLWAVSVPCGQTAYVEGGSHSSYGREERMFRFSDHCTRQMGGRRATTIASNCCCGKHVGQTEVISSVFYHVNCILIVLSDQTYGWARNNYHCIKLLLWKACRSDRSNIICILSCNMKEQEEYALSSCWILHRKYCWDNTTLFYFSMFTDS
jgi:hypothetical protein